MIIIIVFIALTNPLSSHALARAAHYRGISLTMGTVIDRLAELEKTGVESDTQSVQENTAQESKNTN